MPKRAALISVSNRDGIEELAKHLAELDFVILATTGTAAFLKEQGVPAASIEEYTGQKEILGGRVKTLHPKIHAGLLAKRADSSHMQQLEEDQIYQIDVAAVNLYPFIENLNTDKAGSYEKMIELVDIGGPTMIRAAAKNFQSVYPVIDPSDYSKVIESLKNEGPETLQFRKELAAKVFTQLANYNLEIAKYFSGVDTTSDSVDIEAIATNPTSGMVLEKQQDLRYGENPHQSAVFYKEHGKELNWQQLNGKELSYNNLLDLDAAYYLVRSLDTSKSAAIINKHLNPCGAAYADNLAEALRGAKQGDPRSHFGGVIGFNQEVDSDAAQEVVKDFAEIVIAPAYTSEALEVLQSKKNLRVIKMDFDVCEQYELRTCAGGVLLQEKDNQISTVDTAEEVAGRSLEGNEAADLDLAWRVCQHVKSNAITLVKDQKLIATGAGQMSRIDSVEIALNKAQLHDHDTNGAVAASDAFFPFPDSVETLAAAGVKAIIVTGGAKKDEEVAAAAKAVGISLLFTSDRHFRH